MSNRTDTWTVAPALMQQLAKASTELTQTGLERSLTELIKIRASQLNACVRCLDMHVRDALAGGETEERVFMLPAWRESELYTPREKAALGWTESLVGLSRTGAPDADYELVAEQFTPEERVRLTMVIGFINTWNMFGAGFRAPPFKARQAA